MQWWRCRDSDGGPANRALINIHVCIASERRTGTALEHLDMSEKQDMKRGYLFPAPKGDRSFVLCLLQCQCGDTAAVMVRRGSDDRDRSCCSCDPILVHNIVAAGGTSHRTICRPSIVWFET